MSANKTNEFIENDLLVSEFSCDIPIPAYLLAIVSGNIQTQSVGYWTSVSAEPEIIDLAVKELEDIEWMLNKAEEYYFDYEWGNYSFIILPPSYPYGGMENPLLTFAS